MKAKLYRKRFIGGVLSIKVSIMLVQSSKVYLNYNALLQGITGFLGYVSVISSDEGSLVKWSNVFEMHDVGNYP